MDSHNNQLRPQYFISSLVNWGPKPNDKSITSSPVHAGSVTTSEAPLLPRPLLLSYSPVIMYEGRAPELLWPGYRCGIRCGNHDSPSFFRRPSDSALGAPLTSQSCHHPHQPQPLRLCHRPWDTQGLLQLQVLLSFAAVPQR